MPTRCSPVCAVDNHNCCMVRLLSNQDDFRHQESLLEQKIKARGHFCIFLPKFHCKLNPIEMVSSVFLFPLNQLILLYSIGGGASTNTGMCTKINLGMRRLLLGAALMRAQLKLSGDFSIVPGDLWMLTGEDLPELRLNASAKRVGPCRRFCALVRLFPLAPQAKTHQVSSSFKKCH